jgi:hypothetical protein
LQRRSALIASAIAIPVTVLLAFAFSAGRVGSGDNHAASAASSGPLPGVTVTAPPPPDPATQAACVKVFAQLPVQLGSLSPRKTQTDSSFVAAWGNPAVVFRCGVGKPAALGTARAAQLVDVNGVLWQPDPQRDRTIYTAVDRRVYADVTVPAGQDQPLPDLAPAIKALPEICTALDAAGNPTNAKLPLCGA